MAEEEKIKTDQINTDFTWAKVEQLIYMYLNDRDYLDIKIETYNLNELEFRNDEIKDFEDEEWSEKEFNGVLLAHTEDTSDYLVYFRANPDTYYNEAILRDLENYIQNKSNLSVYTENDYSSITISEPSGGVSFIFGG